MSQENPKISKKGSDLMLAVMIIKADIYCKGCGGGGINFGDDTKQRLLFTVCTMCGERIGYQMNDNHIEMYSRMLESIQEKQLKVELLKPYEFIRKSNGKCAGCCGGICSEHLRGE